MVGGEKGRGEEKWGEGFEGRFFVGFFGWDLNIERKIERNIGMRKE